MHRSIAVGRAGRLAAAAFLALGAALAGCAPGGGTGTGGVDPRLVRFCQQIGYAPGTGAAYQRCLEDYSVAGRGQQLDLGAAGLDGGEGDLPN